MGTFVAFLLAAAKAFPVLAQGFEQVVDEIRRQRLAATHAEIDATLDRLQAAPWVCPSRCPHALARAAGLHEPGTADATLPPAP